MHAWGWARHFREGSYSVRGSLLEGLNGVVAFTVNG